jgi:hypothetical protein
MIGLRRMKQHRISGIRERVLLLFAVALMCVLVALAPASATAAPGQSSLTFSTYSIDFGACPSGNHCSASITFTNISGGDLDVAGAGYITFTGSFGAIGSECSGTTATGLASGGSCTFNLDFAPTARGRYIGKMCLSFFDIHPSTICIKLSGTGT